MERVEELYRQKVKELRPDLGRNSAEFIQVKAAMDTLRGYWK
jgi:hypothetical protein